MRAIIAALGMTIAGTTGSALASEGGLMDAATFGDLCKEDKTVSTMYVMGVVEQAYLSRSAKFCIKRGYTMAQARDIMCRYVAEEATGEILKLSAAALTNEVLSLEWPCP